MKFSVPTILSALSIASAVPTTPASAIQPGDWDWELVERSGPGCPGNKTGLSKISMTGTTLIRDKLHYQVFSFPDFKINAGPNAKDTTETTYCDVTVKYTERPAPNSPNTSSNYILSINPHGTYTRAGYNLQGSITARWEFLYEAKSNGAACYTNQELEGPLSDEYSASKLQTLDQVTPGPHSNVYLGFCGSGILNYRITLSLRPHTAEAKGTIDAGEPEFNETAAIRHGFSYSWIPCPK